MTERRVVEEEEEEEATNGEKTGASVCQGQAN